MYGYIWNICYLAKIWWQPLLLDCSRKNNKINFMMIDFLKKMWYFHALLTERIIVIPCKLCLFYVKEIKIGSKLIIVISIKNTVSKNLSFWWILIAVKKCCYWGKFLLRPLTGVSADSLFFAFSLTNDFHSLFVNEWIFQKYSLFGQNLTATPLWSVQEKKQ